jgi:hypothetical protein
VKDIYRQHLQHLASAFGITQISGMDFYIE